MALGLEVWSAKKLWKLGDTQQETMKFKVSLTVLKKLKNQKETTEGCDSLFLGPHPMQWCCPHLGGVFLAQLTQSRNSDMFYSFVFWVSLDFPIEQSILLVWAGPIQKAKLLPWALSLPLSQRTQSG